jgi:hypothetical protein
MPDQAGAFLTASKVIAEGGGNIVRVNYNRAVDTHTLLMEVEATEEQHAVISRRLKDVEYLTDDPGMRQIILIELVLPDRPGSLVPTLEVIKNHEVNIPYINSQENGTPYQNFKLGLLVEDTGAIKGLLDDLSQICEVRVLDYEATDRLLDSTVFYVTFANEMRELFGLSQEKTNDVLTAASKVMQTLDRREESPSEELIKSRGTNPTSVVNPKPPSHATESSAMLTRQYINFLCISLFRFFRRDSPTSNLTDDKDKKR